MLHLFCGAIGPTSKDLIHTRGHFRTTDLNQFSSENMYWLARGCGSIDHRGAEILKNEADSHAFK